MRRENLRNLETKVQRRRKGNTSSSLTMMWSVRFNGSKVLLEPFKKGDAKGFLDLPYWTVSLEKDEIYLDFHASNGSTTRSFLRDGEIYQAILQELEPGQRARVLKRASMRVRLSSLKPAICRSKVKSSNL